MPRETGWLLVIAYLLGLVMLMTAGIYDGPLAEPALVLVLGCGAILGVQFIRLFRPGPAAPWAPRIPLLLAAVGLVVFVVATFADARLLVDAKVAPRLIHVTSVGQLGLLLSYVPSVLSGKRESARWVEARFALFALVLIAGGMSVFALSPLPEIDVFHHHTESARALLRGDNPYLLQIRETGPTHWTYGYAYPPTPAYLSLIALVLGGDARWAMLTALLVAGVAMRLLARGAGNAGSASPNARLPAFAEDAPCLMLWLTPKAYFFIEQSWNDVFPVAFAACTLLAHARGHRRWAAVFLGIALSTKQSMIWFIPLAFLLGFQLIEWVIFLGTAAVTILPFALWDFRLLYDMLFVHLGHFPPRYDGLSPINWLYRHFGVPPRGEIAIVSAALLSVFAAWRAPRTRWSFALATAVAFFPFYILNKWTFMNYYFFLTGLVCVAASVAVGERARTS